MMDPLAADTAEMEKKRKIWKHLISDNNWQNVYIS